jgi:hypothetical protein
MDRQPAGVPPHGYTAPPSPPGDPLIGGDLGGWWSRSMRIVGDGWRPLFLIQLIGLLPQVVLVAPVALLAAFDTEGLDLQAGGTIDGATVAAIGGYALLTVAVVVAVQALTTVGAVHVAVSVALRRPVRLGAAVGYALRRALPLLGWQTLAVLLAVVSLCACIVPVFYVLTVVSVLPAVVAFERGGALTRCFRLFHHRLDVAASRLVIAAVVSFGFTAAGQSLSTFAGGSGALGGAAWELPGIVSGTVAAGLVSAIGGVLIVPLLLTAYADMRAHAEPLSTSVLAAELGLAAGPGR